MTGRLLIAPSLLAADLSNLAAEIADVEKGGADALHVDVMDGHFVPNITCGLPIVAAARKVTQLPLDIHLMIENPGLYVERFAEAGADTIGFHIEADNHAHRTLCQIRALGKRASITLNPQTGVEAIEILLPLVDQVLIMSVNPGFGGQKFIPEVLPKVRALRDSQKKRNLHFDIQVDGGINTDTVQKVVEAGANVLVAGAAVFGHSDRKARIEAIRAAARKV